MRWKCSFGVAPCGIDCGHVRVSNGAVAEMVVTYFGITASSFYRSVALSRLINTKWRRCTQCHRLIKKNARGECSLCHSIRLKEYDQRQKSKDKARIRNKRKKKRVYTRQRPPLTEEQRARKRKTNMQYYFKRKLEGTHREQKYRRRAMKFKTAVLGDKIKKPKRGKCHYCNKAVVGKNLHLDHVVPLSRGGAHASYNIVVACRECNSVKSAKMPDRWTPNGQLELILSHA